MKKQKLKVEVEVWGIEVEETYHDKKTGEGSGWYKFEYSVRVNGGKKRMGQIDSSWSSQTRAHFRRVLGRGEAARIALMHEYL